MVKQIDKYRKTKEINKIKKQLGLDEYIYKEKEIDLLKVIKDDNLIVKYDEVFINLFTSFKKKKIIEIIEKMNKEIKRKKIKGFLIEKINNLFSNTNIKFIHGKGLVKGNIIPGKFQLKDILVPLNLSEKNKQELLNIRRIIKKNKKLTNLDKSNLKKLTNLLNNFFLSNINSIYNQFLEELKLYLDIIENIRYNIEKNNQLNNGDIIYIEEQYRSYFAYIYDNQVYFFNLLLLDNIVVIKKDKIYYGSYKKGLNIFKTENYLKLKKIPKSLILNYIEQLYKLNKEYLEHNIKYKTIFKKDIENFIKQKHK